MCFLSIGECQRKARGDIMKLSQVGLIVPVVYVTSHPTRISPGFLCSFFRYSNNISPKKMKLTLVPPATSMLELHRTGAVWLRLHNELSWLG